MPRVYLDTCSLNRPFDDQRQFRIRRESKAIVAILQRFQDDTDWVWVGSDVLQYEASKIRDAEQRRRILTLLRFAARAETTKPETVQRAKSLFSCGFGALDAMHIACAEQGNCDVLLSTDDRMVRNAARNAGKLSVHVVNPADWLESESMS